MVVLILRRSCFFLWLLAVGLAISDPGAQDEDDKPPKDPRVQELQDKFSNLMEQEGPYEPQLAPLLEELLELEPEDYEALGALMLLRTHQEEYTSALSLARRLKEVPEIPKKISSIAGRLTAGLTAVTEARPKDAIPILRRLSASVGIEDEKDKAAWHHAIEAEAMVLAESLDEKVRANKDANWQGTKTEQYVPGLTAQGFWSVHQFEFGEALEKAAEVVRDEVTHIRIVKPITKRWKAVTTRVNGRDEMVLGGEETSDWSELILFKDGKFNQKNCKRLPETCGLLSKYPELTTNPRGLASIRQLKMGTETMELQGRTNAQLTVNLCLQVPLDRVAGIRVGGQTAHCEQNKVLVYDDSFKHTLWHSGGDLTGWQTVLHATIWHPEVSPAERQTALKALAQGSDEGGDKPWPPLELNAALQYLQTKEAKTRWQDEFARASRSNFEADVSDLRAEEL